MKKLIKILLIIPLTFATAIILNAQGVAPVADTIGTKAQKTEKQTQSKEQSGTENQVREQSGNREQAQGQVKKSSSGEVKQVRSARPNSMSGGARPASVERPSGSRVPKGVGKPGGVKGPGKR
jgi:predicted Holliday junction resolvase-like endonuclease